MIVVTNSTTHQRKKTAITLFTMLLSLLVVWLILKGIVKDNFWNLILGFLPILLPASVVLSLITLYIVQKSESINSFVVCFGLDRSFLL